MAVRRHAGQGPVRLAPCRSARPRCTITLAAQPTRADGTSQFYAKSARLTRPPRMHHAHAGHVSAPRALGRATSSLCASKTRPGGRGSRRGQVSEPTQWFVRDVTHWLSVCGRYCRHGQPCESPGRFRGEPAGPGIRVQARTVSVGDLERARIVLLADRLRAGWARGCAPPSDRTPPKLTQARKDEILATTLAPPPAELGLTHWSSRLLAKHLGQP
jgi:hypothetical protein